MEPRKRRRVEVAIRGHEDQENVLASTSSTDRLNVPYTRRSISPPLRKRSYTTQGAFGLRTESPSSMKLASTFPSVGSSSEPASKFSTSYLSSIENTVSPAPLTLVPSPIQLISIKDLPDALNVDTISLKDILGDPLIKECWVFNFLIDVDFVMSQFDEDTRDLVQVKIVHGSWKKDAPNKIRIDQAVARYPNVQAIVAYMPEAYGTHHSKMIVLFRHDDQVQVVILTANMVAGDWRMCQAVWRSPLLPLQTGHNNPERTDSGLPPLGGGERFKHDLFAYLRTYEKRTKDLVAQLSQYDFTSIRAALIASTPSKQNLRSLNSETEDLWGWPSIKRVLSGIPATSPKPHIVSQISSVASIGEKWVEKTFFEALSSSAAAKPAKSTKPKFSIVFPTPDEIRGSIDGYDAGGSIHMKIQSTTQNKQLAYLRPMLCHWAGDREHRSCNPPSPTSPSSIHLAIPVQEAGRRRAAPHIKTYIRFADASHSRIDWAMLTSANLSTQAWGGATNAAGEVRVCSYEIGVVVWPALWNKGAEGGNGAEMVPVFRKDTPDETSTDVVLPESGSGSGNGNGGILTTKVGWRMPYDLPLVPYALGEMPWCASEACEERDWMGRSWPGF